MYHKASFNWFLNKVQSEKNFRCLPACFFFFGNFNGIPLQRHQKTSGVDVQIKPRYLSYASEGSIDLIIFGVEAEPSGKISLMGITGVSQAIAFIIMVTRLFRFIDTTKKRNVFVFFKSFNGRRYHPITDKPNRN